MSVEIQIATFLENGALNYHYGVSLLRQVCKNRSLVNSLSIKENQFNQEKLIYELNKHQKPFENHENKEFINEHFSPRRKGEENASLQATRPNVNQRNEGDKQPIKKSIDQTIHSDVSKPGNIYSHDLDLSIQVKIHELQTERNGLYGQRDHFHGQLLVVNDETERYKLALKIDSIQPKIDHLNNQISAIKNEKQLPKSVVENLMSLDDYKALKKYESYIRRYKNLAKKSTKTADIRKNETLQEKYEVKKQQILTKYGPN